MFIVALLDGRWVEYIPSDTYVFKDDYPSCLFQRDAQIYKTEDEAIEAGRKFMETHTGFSSFNVLAHVEKPIS